MESKPEDTIECGNCGANIPATAKVCPECKVTLYEEMAEPEKDSTIAQDSEDETSSQLIGILADNEDDDEEDDEDEDELDDEEYEDIDLATPVYIVDFDMPFWSIVKFMIKVALASIPALLILGIIGGIFWAILGGVILGLVNHGF